MIRLWRNRALGDVFHLADSVRARNMKATFGLWLARRGAIDREDAMAFDSADRFSRPVPFALAAVAVVGWLLAAFFWSQVSQTRTETTQSLRSAERAREALATDLQNLQKAAGTAADLKKQAADAEKALSDASAARASAQNELADLTKQIGDAKLAISGAQEEASARTRDLQAVDARLKEASDRFAAEESQSQALLTEQTRVQGEVAAAQAALAQARDQTAAAQKQFEGLQNQINAATSELNALQDQIRAARARVNSAP